MSQWPSSKARKVFAALLRLGWQLKRQSGSHRTLAREGWPDALLQVRDPMQKLRDLHRQRDPLYEQTAHYIIDTGRPSIATLVNMILMQLELAGLLDAASVPSSVVPHLPHP